jgi:hypothetical protein
MKVILINHFMSSIIIGIHKLLWETRVFILLPLKLINHIFMIAYYSFKLINAKK